MSDNIREDSYLLQVGGLHIFFGEKEVVNDVSFQIRAGEVLGIVGESGSGKSMTALSLMGLCPPQAKIVAHQGILLQTKKNPVNIASVNSKTLRSIRGNIISMIFQEPMTSLNAVQKCGPQVEEVLLIHKKEKKRKAKSRVIELFQEVMLPDPEKVYHKYPHQLSGGQRQRVMIAMSLACRPALLIADEPTTALDVTVQKTIIQLLKDLQQKYGMSILFISHDLGVVSEICHRVLIMHKGYSVEELTKEQLINGNVNHPYTKALLSCRPPVDRKPYRLQTVSEIVEETNTNKEPIIQLTEKKQTGEIIMNIHSLSKHFPTGKNIMGKPTAWFKAVDDVSFEIFSGETLGLVGESGCGKTTLSRMLLKLIDKTSGNIDFNGRDIQTLSKKETKDFRKQAQIIFQDPYSSLNPNMTIGTALTEPLKVHQMFHSKKERVEYVVDILQKTGLNGDDLKKYPHQFSGGQRQRIVIARAMVLKPAFIICDEAVSALDVSVQAQVLNLLNDLKESDGLTYLFISHDLSVVRYMSQRIMVMQHGKIVESGLSDEVFNNPANEYTRKLIESIPGNIH